MGKASRRQANASGVLALPRIERTELLLRSARLVAEYNATKPQCIECAALVVRAGELLGFRSEPVPVAVAVEGPAGAVQLGSALDGTIPLLPGGQVRRTGGWNSWDGAGHVIVHVGDDDTLIDTTLDQTSGQTGLPRGALILPNVARAALDEPGVSVDLPDGGQALYRAVPSDRSWQTPYNAQYARKGPVARAVVRRALELRGHEETLQAL
jgi:hypothetical protein